LSDPNFWINGPPREGYFRIYQDTNPVQEGHDLDNVWSYLSQNQILRFTSRLRGNQRDAYFVGTVAHNSPAPLSPTSIGADTRFEDTSLAGSLYQYRFEWAELAYFLRPQVDPISKVQDTANGQSLFTLYRRQWLASPDNYALSSSQRVPVTFSATVANPSPPPATISVTEQNMQFYLETSTMPDPAGGVAGGDLYFNSPIDMTVPPRRMGTKTASAAAPYVPYSPNALFSPSSTLLSVPTLAEDYATTIVTTPPVTITGQPLIGADMLLTDVISFDVRILISGNTDFVSIDDSTVQAYASNNPNYNANATAYSSTSLTNKYLFDTWSAQKDDVYDFTSWAPTTSGTNNTIPLYQNSSGQLISIKAVQITLRIWDTRTSQTRQVTIVQDL
jgi:hypothetical protein